MTSPIYTFIETFEPLPLTHAGTDKIVAYACGKCHTVVASVKFYGEKSEDVARKHCGVAQYQCWECGVNTPKYCTRCEGCVSKERYEKAEKITPDEWQDEWVSDGAQYFENLEMFFDYYFDTKPEDRPDFIYTTNEVRWSGIHLGNLFERELEEYYCDEGGYDPVDHLTDVAELEAFLKKWNEKQDIAVYEENRMKIIVLTPEDWEKAYKD